MDAPESYDTPYLKFGLLLVQATRKSNTSRAQRVCINADRSQEHSVCLLVQTKSSKDALRCSVILRSFLLMCKRQGTFGKPSLADPKQAVAAGFISEVTLWFFLLILKDRILFAALGIF